MGNGVRSRIVLGALLFAATVIAGACGGDYDNGYAVNLILVTDGSVDVGAIRRLRIDVAGAETTSRSFDAAGHFATGEERIIYRPQATAGGTLDFTATLLDGAGADIAQGRVSVALRVGQTVTTTLTLTARGVPGPDLTMPPVDLATSDLGAPPDLKVADLAAPDLSPADLAAPDLRPADLATPPDLTVLPDLKPPPDLTMLPDLKPPPDLTVPPDLTALPDLIVPVTTIMRYPTSTECGAGYLDEVDHAIGSGYSVLADDLRTGSCAPTPPCTTTGLSQYGVDLTFTLNVPLSATITAASITLRGLPNNGSAANVDIFDAETNTKMGTCSFPAMTQAFTDCTATLSSLQLLERTTTKLYTVDYNPQCYFVYDFVRLSVSYK